MSLYHSCLQVHYQLRTLHSSIDLYRRPNNAVAIDTVRLAIALPVSIVTIVLLCCGCGIFFYRLRHHQQAFAQPPRQLMHQSAIHTPVNQPRTTASQPQATQPPDQQQQKPTALELTSTAPPSYDQAKEHTTITLNGESASPPMTTLPSYEDLTISATADNSSEALSPQPQEQGETNWVTNIQVVISDGTEATVGEQHTSEEHVEPREQDSAM